MVDRGMSPSIRAPSIRSLGGLLGAIGKMKYRRPRVGRAAAVSRGSLNRSDFASAGQDCGHTLSKTTFRLRHYLLLTVISLGIGVSPLTSSAAEQPNGRRLYLRYCASCHGESGKGDGPDAPYFVAPPRNLREGFLGKYSTADLVRRVREGRSIELALDVPALKRRAVDVEDIVSHLKRLPTMDWRRIEPGWEVYVDRCELCHGPYGRPPPLLPRGVRAPRDLSDPKFQRSLSDDELLAAVRRGRVHTPALVPRLTKPEAEALLLYLRLLSPGFELYTDYCAACHGDDGRGIDYGTESMRAPAVVFDREYFAKREPEQIREGVWHMLGAHKPIMPHFRWQLSEEQARAIVEYLQQTEPKQK